MTIERLTVDPQHIQDIVDSICPKLDGLEMQVQAAVLADLTSLWLAGSFIVDDDGKINRRATNGMRKRLLAMHVAQVKLLIKPNEEALLEHGKAHAKDLS